MAARSKARTRALDILFEADQRGLNAETLLDERLGDSESRAANNPYTADLVRGVVGRWNDINAALTDYSQGWTLERMPAVDRAILRLGAWEVLWNDEIPDGVAISEAVALATDLSTDESPAFVNGLLARIAEVKATIV
ncbi:transcription antitermination factor NusB [Terrabacter sp. LjRoot27]|uniref:transcription antitermination factor NusB n=1 Tax=Terrabacter sp. LjRoot27 TaxID=3342306 RepID=UPI003ECD81A4